MLRLARYFFRLYLGVILLTLFALVVLVVAVTLVENAGELTRNQDGSFIALKLALYAGVEYAYQTLPIACFVAVLVAGTQLARRGEVLAVQAAGRGPLHLWGPFIGVVVLMAILGSACGEVVLPRAIAQRQQVQQQIRRVDALSQFYARRTQWFRERDIMLYLPGVDAPTATFTDPVVYRMRDGLIVGTIAARQLAHDAEGWFLTDADERRVAAPEVVHTARLPLPLRVTPGDLIDVTGNPRELSTREMAALIGRRQNAGFDTTAHRVELHSRFAYPFGAVWMVLLAVPWALDPNRRRSLAATLGGGVVAIAAQLSLSQLFRLLALAHKIPAGVGAWGAAGVGLAALPLSLWCYRRKRQRGHIF